MTLSVVCQCVCLTLFVTQSAPSFFVTTTSLAERHAVVNVCITIIGLVEDVVLIIKVMENWDQVELARCSHLIRLLQVYVVSFGMERHHNFYTSVVAVSNKILTLECKDSNNAKEEMSRDTE